MVGKDKNSRRVEGKAMTTRILRAGFMFALVLRLMRGMRRTLMLLFSTAVGVLLASGAVLALPSQKPDNTPMVDGRVRAIKQVGNNVWLGGRISQVTRRDGTLLAKVGNLAVLDSQTNRYKPIAPKLGGTDAEVWDIEPYGESGDLLIGGTFAGPTPEEPPPGRRLHREGDPVVRLAVAEDGSGCARAREGLWRGEEPLGVRLCHWQEALEQGEGLGRTSGLFALCPVPIP